MEITKNKVTELFCIIDEFCKLFEAENAGKVLWGEDGVKHRRRKASLSKCQYSCMKYISITEPTTKVIKKNTA